MKKKLLFLDYEVRSNVDLIKRGVAPYAEDINTMVICASIAYNNSEVFVVRDTNKIREILRKALKNGYYFVAHNVLFEWHISKLVVGVHIPLEKWIDTMDYASREGIRHSLEGAAICLGLAEKKDTKGAELMRQVCIPNKTTGDFVNTNSVLNRTYSYCRQDTVTCRAIYNALATGKTQRPSEWELEEPAMEIVRRINLNGVPIDMDTVPIIYENIQKSLALVEKELMERRIKNPLNADELKGGKLSRIVNTSVLTSPKQFLNLLRRRYKLDLPDSAKDTLDTIVIPDDQSEELKTLIRYRTAVTSAGVKKFPSAMNTMNKDHRIVGTHQYHGAHTGRMAGRGFQVQNLSRGKLDIKELAKDTNLGAEYLIKAGQCVRGMIKHPTRNLIQADFKGVEARVQAWLVNDERTLENFRKGLDPYKVMAASIYHIPYERVSKEQRQHGKVAVLGLGYQMGKARFIQSSMDQYRVDLSDELAQRIISLYRRQAHNKVSAFWEFIQNQFVRCIKIGKTGRSGTIELDNYPLTLYVRIPEKGMVDVYIKLPSGRCIKFHDTNITEGKWGPSITYKGYKGHALITKYLYGGMIFNNIVQGIAADLLTNCLYLMEGKVEVVMLVHDEVVAIENDSFKEKDLIRIMSITPSWAEGLPLEADGWTNERFKKD